MDKDFFADHGGYLYHIDLRHTMDPHSRQIVVDRQMLGYLLFHDWKFKFDFGVDSRPVDARVILQVIKEANRDTSIQHQYIADNQQMMARNARTFLSEQQVDLTGLSDREVVQRYLNYSKPELPVTLNAQA